MKRIIPKFGIRVIGIIIFLCVGTSFLIRPFVVYLAKKSLRNIFTGSSVYIGSSSRPFTGFLSFYKIEIKRAQDYDLQAGSIRINYTLPLLLKGIIPHIEIKDVTVNINLQKKKISQFGNYLNTSSRGPFFIIDGLKISNLNINLKTEDVSLLLRGSFDGHLLNPLIHSLDVDITSLESAGFQLKAASLKVSQGIPQGELSIKNVSYNKIKMSDIKGKANLNGTLLSVSPLSAEVWDGKLQGSATFFLDKTSRYLLNVKAYSIPVETIIKEFNLSEKINASGNLNGNIALQGSGITLSGLKGGLKVSEPGGFLSIQDTRFLETIARNTKQSLEMVMESFKDYRYNKGDVGISLEGENLIFTIALGGNQGERNLNIVIHNFKWGGGL